ncbi:hypothetical protein MSAN_02506900 [Mycena sanguinolenta]|uniref:CxC1-like cysteine cluster associated with KDZ transposases domain-containing protein n=1 Tax=Mycena sanguinolenta TaxID=230812 RepID=A0A8H6TW73_9AGAR|nr:hypothetical protein MSAN_02506900 [Mycena sanguinolenta]
MVGSRRAACDNQRASASGAGVSYSSPIRKRDKHKNKKIQRLGHAARSNALLARIRALEEAVDDDSPEDVQDTEDAEMPDWNNEGDNAPAPPAPVAIPTRPIIPKNRSARATTSWNLLLPHLEKPFAEYRQASYAQPPTPHPADDYPPLHGRLRPASLCHCAVSLYLSCTLPPAHAFPLRSYSPRTGVSIDLLEVYRALFERSSDAITALAAALHTVYGRRGFQLISERNPGLRATDPFRSALSNAVLWLSHLRDRLQVKLEASLLASENALRSSEPDPVPTAAPPPPTLPTHTPTPPMRTPSTAAPPPPTPPMHTPTPPTPTPSTRSRAPASAPAPGHYVYTSAHLDTRARARAASIDAWARAPNITRTLSRLFQFDGVGSTNGTVCPQIDDVRTLIILVSGGDVMVGCDGNFSLRHLNSAGTGPISYDPSYFISKEKEEGPSEIQAPIPQEAFDSCQESWDAANEKKQKTDVRHYDSSGVFVMTCRHSQVRFLCDMDTPGEQQKYIVALLEELNSHLLPQATIVEGYDVACVTDHSFNLYPILTEGLRPRVSFIINAMHVFGHQWVCQMVYSPRLRRGIGLTDLEGVERFWSRIRKLIPITCNQWNSRRIWMIDKYASFINEEGLDGLGNWIHRQEMKNLAAKQAAAAKVLRECRVPEDELQSQWEAQKAAQSSLRAHAPARLKRELDKVLGLQVQIDAVEKSIAEAKQSIMSGDASQETLALLRRLEATHTTLSTQAEALYASLNIQDNFPELQDLPLEFVRTLLMMRDLKINIRKCAVGSFYEWETLDRAVSGRREPLGTKLHQATRKAISKRQPALMRSIRKFNDYCELLARLRPENCTIPIPSALSTQLNGLTE